MATATPTSPTSASFSPITAAGASGGGATRGRSLRMATSASCSATTATAAEKPHQFDHPRAASEAPAAQARFRCGSLPELPSVARLGCLCSGLGARSGGVARITGRSERTRCSQLASRQYNCGRRTSDLDVARSNTPPQGREIHDKDEPNGLEPGSAGRAGNERKCAGWRALRSGMGCHSGESRHDGGDTSLPSSPTMTDPAAASSSTPPARSPVPALPIPPNSPAGTAPPGNPSGVACRVGTPTPSRSFRAT